MVASAEGPSGDADPKLMRKGRRGPCILRFLSARKPARHNTILLETDMYQT